jgi:hypothetical protein
MCLRDIRCFIYMNLHLEYPGITLLNSVTSIVITAKTSLNERHIVMDSNTKNV